MTTVARRQPDGSALVAGLEWDVASVGMGKSEARARARSATASAFLLRTDRNLGLLKKNPVPDATRLFSFAAVLAGEGEQGWCGVFEFEGAYVYVAVNEEGSVLPDSDRVFASEQAARERLIAEAPFFSTVYAPRSWAIDGSEDAGARLPTAADWTKGTPLQVIRQRRVDTKVFYLGAALAVAICVVGFKLWSDHRAAAEQEALASQAPPPPPPDPWLQRPSPSAAARACLAVREGLASTHAQGWLIDQLACDVSGGTYTAVLKPYTNYNRLPLPALPAPVRLVMRSDGSGIEVTGKAALPPRPRTGARPSLETALAVRNFLYASAKQANWQIQGTRDQFSFALPADLDAVATALDAFPTTIINRIEYTGGLWRVQGEVYH